MQPVETNTLNEQTKHSLPRNVIQCVGFQRIDREPVHFLTIRNLSH